jgi:YD repeat-containing protein
MYNKLIFKIMEAIQVNRTITKRMSVTSLLQRFMFLMGIIIMSMTFTACVEDDDGEEGGNDGASNSNYRVKKLVLTSTNPSFEDNFHWDVTYNGDGTVKRIDQYKTATNEHWSWWIYTANLDGQVAKSEPSTAFGLADAPVWVCEWVYDAFKKPVTASGYSPGVTSSMEMTYSYNASGQLISLTKTWIVGPIYTHVEIEIQYDTKGRITKTIGSINGQTTQHTWTYNSDGNPHTITGPYSATDSTPVIHTFQYEKGKSNYSPIEIYFDLG